MHWVEFNLLTQRYTSLYRTYLLIKDTQDGYSMVYVHYFRVIIDGDDSATVFNGLTPLYDALYSKASNFITGRYNILMYM